MQHMEKPKMESVCEMQIKETLDLLKKIFEKDLLGVYLYGSSTHQGMLKYSDIDLLAISQRGFTPQEEKLFIDQMLKISSYPKNDKKTPIELTLMEKSQVSPWRYPPQFFFQYGEWLRERFEKKETANDIWPQKEMPDLAVLITLARLSGVAVFGKDPKEVLPAVPYKDFMRALVEGVSYLSRELYTDTRNVLLTLARILMTLETDTIFSKTDSASLVMEKIPQELRLPMERAKKIALGVQDNDFSDMKNLLEPLLEFMLQKIKTEVALVFNGPDKEVRLGKKPS